MPNKGKATRPSLGLDQRMCVPQRLLSKQAGFTFNLALSQKHCAIYPNAKVLRAYRQVQAFFRLKRAILEDYSYRDLRRVDWKKRFGMFERTMLSSTTAMEFAHQAANLLSAAKDIHIWIKVNGEILPTHKRCVRRNIAPWLLPKLVPFWNKCNSVVDSGHFPDGISYLCLRAWPSDKQRELRVAYEVLSKAARSGCALIIDVRANCGGSEALAARFAGCFIKRPVCYARHLRRHAGNLIGPISRWLVPNKAHPTFQGKVVVLAGAGTVSSCESFVQMMKQVDGCKVIGQCTAGASGNPKPVKLGNGVIVFVPTWQDLSVDGICLEGRGVGPDVEVRVRENDFQDQDPVLATALKFLRTPFSSNLRRVLPAPDIDIRRLECST